VSEGFLDRKAPKGSEESEKEGEWIRVKKDPLWAENKKREGEGTVGDGTSRTH